jgi:hypothetical protein
MELLQEVYDAGPLATDPSPAQIIARSEAICARWDAPTLRSRLGRNRPEAVVYHPQATCTTGQKSLIDYDI